MEFLLPRLFHSPNRRNPTAGLQDPKTEGDGETAVDTPTWITGAAGIHYDLESAHLGAADESPDPIPPP